MITLPHIITRRLRLLASIIPGVVEGGVEEADAGTDVERKTAPPTMTKAMG